jgi:potassium-transporting ATPase potassium-binding subunit
MVRGQPDARACLGRLLSDRRIHGGRVRQSEDLYHPFARPCGAGALSARRGGPRGGTEVGGICAVDGRIRRRLHVCALCLTAAARLSAAQSAELPGVSPDLAFNIAISFITNADWQAYGGETTLSHLSQMVGLTANNFLDSAAAIAIAVALIRALSRSESKTIGNFWVDMTGATLYVLLPLALVVALAFTTLGVPQTLTGSIQATTLEGAKQAMSIGPVTSQEAIKLIGDNGGGFFNATSTHPFENPSVWSNIVQNWSQLVLPVALVFAFGRMVGDPRQGRALLIAMAILFVGALIVFYWCETHGNPILTALGVDPSQGNMEGKDLRFGQAGSALFVQATTGTGTGASNGVLESMMPLSGTAALFTLLLGCISPGGVGTGLYSLLLLVFITAFMGALMIGRTPEYLGKKISTREMQFALFALLLSPALILIFAGASSMLRSALDSLGIGGPHGLSEIVYAYASSAADNGSLFVGLSANTLWYNITTGLVMFFGRFAHAIPILAIAGSLAAKKKAKPPPGDAHCSLDSCWPRSRS